MRVGEYFRTHLAQPHRRSPVLEGHAGDDQEHDLRQGLDGDDPAALELHQRAQSELFQWHYADRNPSHYEEDHLISLALGGAPRSKRNLWPQPSSQARRDDSEIEARLHWQVCKGTLSLRQARELELAYKRKRG